MKVLRKHRVKALNRVCINEILIKRVSLGVETIKSFLLIGSIVMLYNAA